MSSNQDINIPGNAKETNGVSDVKENNGEKPVTPVKETKTGQSRDNGDDFPDVYDIVPWRAALDGYDLGRVRKDKKVDKEERQEMSFDYSNVDYIDLTGGDDQ